MADEEATVGCTNTSSTKLMLIVEDLPEELKVGEKIVVTVESSLPDILVVSYQHGRKNFQGALLDATKR